MKAEKDLEQTIANDPSASRWLKEQVEATKKRDPVDGLNDTETLMLVLKTRIKSLQEENKAL